NSEAPSSCLPFKEVPGPCDPEDLLDGVIFGAKYLGSTQLVSERNPPTSVRMAQAQEAVDRIKAPEGESQPMTEVDLFVSTQRIKVLTADTQEAMMDHSLQTISYIADIGSLVVLMARRKLPQRPGLAQEKRLYKMICHVFHSPDAQIIAQAIGQAFGVAYQRFLEANSIDPSELSPRQYSRALEDQEQYNAELTHFSRQENCKDSTTAVIRRPDSKYQLGFCVENGVVSAPGTGAGPGQAQPGAGRVHGALRCHSTRLHSSPA
ncbi:PREDICTED: amyloid beta A4 precursor protein-binding family A member 3-like, partial [Merops nubicus]|uniref:amyloid beta A4 precursor protein-binding family A member 3-like n=1 Tax=Merops nubicus TaxID=57421 RepID=UPI0004F0AB55